jgi:Membrane bound beta barrel domain (DUF5777)
MEPHNPRKDHILRKLLCPGVLAATFGLLPLQVAAQPADPAAAPPPPALEEQDDAVLVVGQPDFTLLSLPTGLRLPVYKWAFRVTHRFRRSLGEGDFGDLLSDAFGLDGGSVTGLEIRFGLLPGAQVGVHRTGFEKTIELFGQYDVTRARDWPFNISVWGSIDGTDNFQDRYSPAIGGIVTFLAGEHGAFYLEPIWVNNSNPLPDELVDDNSTFILGVGGRVQLFPTWYVTAEWVPRVSGFESEQTSDHISFAFEKRVGGHMFQINFSNSFATTMGELARGGFKDSDDNDNWYLGFNITRKFF